MNREHNEDTTAATRSVHVTSGMGLHARPAAKLAQEAQKFAARITLQAGDQEVDAKSILDILTLAAQSGRHLVIRADGSDANAALDHLEGLFRNNFNED